MSVEPVKDVINKITLFRPGHADLAGINKFDFDDIRNVLERSSARETAMRVALASICKKFLLEANITIQSRVLSIGDVHDKSQITDFKNLNNIADKSQVICYYSLC